MAQLPFVTLFLVFGGQGKYRKKEDGNNPLGKTRVKICRVTELAWVYVRCLQYSVSRMVHSGIPRNLLVQVYIRCQALPFQCSTAFVAVNRG